MFVQNEFVTEGINNICLGGLNLSRSCLDRDSRSRHRKKVSLDGRENLDTEKKLVSTPRTFSISISIGLDCQDHHAYNIKFIT